MIYVSSQPDSPYFHWQVQVYVRNFIANGIIPQNIHVVFLIDQKESDGLIDLRSKLPDGVQVFSYQIDKRPYQAMYKPQGMAKHQHKIFGSFFYHDSDIIFLHRKPDVEKLCTCAWYGSDCSSYLGVDYIKSKGERLFEDMCESIHLNPKMIESEQHCVGAQYVMNMVKPEFWAKVEADSLTLYQVMTSHKTQIGHRAPIQAWTAEMWATLWNMYAWGPDVKTEKELDFTFATSPISETEKVNILHNAGVLPQNREKMFFKGDFTNKNPFGIDKQQYSKEYASWKYVEELHYF